MKILFFGSLKKNTYSKYTFDLLKKNFKSVDVIDTDHLFLSKYVSSFVVHGYPKIIEFYLDFIIRKKIKKSYDLFFVIKGDFLGKKTLTFLKKNKTKICFLCLDNPFFNRDKRKWALTLDAITLYDLVIFQQRTRIRFAKKLNLKHILIKPLYDKKVCKTLTSTIKKKIFKRNIIFLGTWFPDRGKFAKNLINLGLNFEIHGPQWNKDSNYNYLKKYIKSNFRLNGLSYAKIISESKIVISLPNNHNDDDITNKSIEIPAFGSLLLTKNSKSHREIFIKSKDAFFFENAKDCVAICNRLLKNTKKIKQVSINGHNKIVNNIKFDYEKNLVDIVTKFF